MLGEAKNRILLVEDDPDTRCALTLLFELEGFDVSSAADGQEAYLMAMTDQPDVIVTDINMPKVSGLDLIRLLKSDGKLAGVPIVAMSAVERQQLNSAIELGAIAVYQKPIEFDKFLSIIANLVSARRALSQHMIDSRRLVARERNRDKN
jgi:adenylate cyclase